MHILGIETSCDETSAAVVDDTSIYSNVVWSQQEHAKYGGIVPELASRAHVRAIVPVIETWMNIRFNKNENALSILIQTYIFGVQ